MSRTVISFHSSSLCMCSMLIEAVSLVRSIREIEVTICLALPVRIYIHHTTNLHVFSLSNLAIIEYAICNNLFGILLLYFCFCVYANCARVPVCICCCYRNGEHKTADLNDAKCSYRHEHKRWMCVCMCVWFVYTNYVYVCGL